MITGKTVRNEINAYSTRGISSMLSIFRKSLENKYKAIVEKVFVLGIGNMKITFMNS